MAISVDLRPYAHPAVANARALAGVLAPRPHWSQRDLTKLTRQFATRAAEELHQAARFDPIDRWRLLLARTEQVEVWLLTWTPWQGTGPHEHDGAAGAYTVLLGELTGTWRDDRDRSRQAVRAAGSSASFGAGQIHALCNHGTMEAISVHAYSPAG
jgi:predicted metal-dependent enzyme (double-stranded beta helix superfamily)